MFIFRPKSSDESPLAAALMPVDFFEVKKGKPRGNYATMGVFTIAILFATVATFIYLAIDGSRNTTTVSEVMGEDLTGINGWETCTMVSKVNDAYAYSANSSYSLVNVMESKTECAVSLAAASPCDSDYVQFLATWESASVSWSTYAPTGLTAIDSSGNLWALNNDATYPTLYVYKPSTGETAFENKASTSLASSPSGDASIVDTDSSGRVISVYDSADASDYTNVYPGLRYYDPSSGTETLVELPVLPLAIAVDSSDVVWFIYWSQQYASCDPADNDYFTIYKYDPSIDITSKVASFSSYTARNIMEVKWLAIGPSGDLWGMFKTSNCNFLDYAYVLYKYDKSSATIIDVADLSSYFDSSDPSGFTVDSDGVVWIISDDGDATLLKYDPSTEDVTIVATGLTAEGATASCQGLVSDSNNGIYFTNIINGDGSLYRYDTTSGSLEALQSFSSSFVSWFVCGDATQSTVPLTDEQSRAACSLNGVKWQISIPVRDFFNSAEMETYSLNSVLSKCTNEIYDAVCNVVAELPPYICTKEVKSEIFIYLGVAAANAEILYAALVFLCGLVLDMVKAYFVKDRGSEGNHGESGSLEAGSMELAASGGFQANKTSGGAPSVSPQDVAKAIAANNAKYDRKIAALEASNTALKVEVGRLQDARASVGAGL